MALSHSPQIVTRNILLNLDFGNIQKCYNGSENLTTYSEQFDNAVWAESQANVTITTNATAAPNGTNTADLISNTGQVVSLIGTVLDGLPTSSTTDYYATVYAKKGTASYFTFNCYYGGNTEDNVSFNFDTGEVTSVPYPGEYIFQNVGNGWYRCGFRMTRDSTGTRTLIYFRFWQSGRALTSGNTYFWGAQLEKGKVPSPYVQTVASSITRPTTATSTISNYTHTINQPQYISYDATNNSIRFDRNETFVNFTGSISGTVLTVSAVSSGTFTTGMALSYSGITPTITISSFGTGTGSTGTYNLSANAGTVTSRAMTAAYKIGGSMSVDTSGPLASNTYLYNDHTTEVWARINDRNAGLYDSYEGESVLVTYAGYHSMFLYNANYLIYYIWDNTGPTITGVTTLSIGTSGTNIIQGQWFQVAVSKSGSTFKTYLNGSLIRTDTATSTAFVGVTNRLAIGSAYDGNLGSFYYYGKNDVGCLKMYNAALSADEISQNFNALRGRFGI